MEIGGNSARDPFDGGARCVRTALRTRTHLFPNTVGCVDNFAGMAGNDIHNVEISVIAAMPGHLGSMWERLFTAFPVTHHRRHQVFPYLAQH